MLVDPLSNFYLYYSLEKNDGTAVSERVQVSEACWHSSGSVSYTHLTLPTRSSTVSWARRCV